MGRNFLFRAIQFALVHVWPLAVLLLAAVLLAPERLGGVAILMAVATLMRPLVGLSLGRAALRVATEERDAARARGLSSRRARAASDPVLHVTMRAGLPAIAMGGVLAVGAMVGADRVYGLFDAAHLLVLACLFVVAVGVVEFLDGLLRTAERFGLLAGALVLSRMAGLAALGLGLLAFGGAEERFALLLAALVLAEVTCIALLLPPAWRQGRPADPALRMRVSRGLLRAALPVVINALSIYVYARAMVLIAAVHDTPGRVGAMELAIQIANMPMAVTIVIASVLAPALSGMASQRHGAWRVRLAVSRGAAFTLCFAMISAVVLAVLGPATLRWLLPQHPAAADVLLILAPLVALKAAAQILSGEVAIARGGAATVARITLASGIVTVLAGWFGARAFGVEGAAWALVLGHSAGIAATLALLPGRIGLYPRYRLRACILLALPPMLTGACAMALLPAGGWSVLGGLAVIGVTTWAALRLSVRRKWSLHLPLADGLALIRARRGSDRPPAAAPSAAWPDTVRAHARRVAPEASAFWIDGRGHIEDASPQDHADMVYMFELLGQGAQIHPQAAARFQAWLAVQPLFGRPVPPPADAVQAGAANAHLTAYLLGTSRLLAARGTPADPALYTGWERARMLDPQGVPRWPRAWAHHVWRVSHWIGGIPSILLHLARARPDSDAAAATNESDVQAVLGRCETVLVDRKSGLLRPWRSALAQRAFRRLYRLRHDPDAADIGGIVHLLWVHHATGRPIVGAAALHAKACAIMGRKPLIEAVPYCLDFDLVQVARLTSPAPDDPRLRALAAKMSEAIVAYLQAPAPSYALHRIPGALAALHECAIILDAPVGADSRIGPPRDIIAEAFWL